MFTPTPRSPGGTSAPWTLTTSSTRATSSAAAAAAAAATPTPESSSSATCPRRATPSAEDEEGGAGVKAVAEGGTLRIPFIYEDILAEHAPEGGEPTALATVPDLIALIDSQSGKPAGVPEYRYSCYVTVLDIPCSPRWSETKRGIEVGGPKGYGYDLEYRPLGKYAEPRSVISGIAP